MRCVWDIFSPVRFRRAADVSVQLCAMLSVTAALAIVDQRGIIEAENVRISDVVDSPFGVDYNDTFNDVIHQFSQEERSDKSSPLIPEDHARPSKLHFRKRQPSETGPSMTSTWNAATGNEFLDAGDDEEDTTDDDDGVQYNAETGIELASNPLQRRLPQAIIIGVKKGGTRALLEFLKAHPDVRAPNPEIHFFDRHYDRGLEWYRKQMPLTTENQLTIEKTPSYFITKLAPSRVYNMSLMMENEVGRSGGVRLIVVVRDPVTRAVSDYTQAAAKRPDLEPFDQLAFLDSPHNSDLSATSKFHQQRDDAPPPSPRVVDTSWGAIKIGLYARHLERWLRFFPPNRIHFVHGERLVVDPAGELALVQDFLGLRRLVTAEMFHFNATKGFPCLLRRQTPPPPPPLAPTSSTSESTSLRPEMNLSSSSASLAFGSNSTFNRTSSSFSLRCLGKTKGRVHPTIDAVVLQRLRDFYRPFNEKFYAMTRINFGWL